MTCKSSKPPLIDSFLSGRATALLLSLWFAGTVSLAHAQQPDASKDPKAYIRCWNMLPDKPTNNLLVFAGDKPLFGQAPFDLYTDYLPCSVGSFNLVIKRSGDNPVVVQKIPVVLQDKMFITLLATEKNGQPAFEVLNDTVDPKVVELSAQLIVRSFMSGARVTVGVTGGQPPQPVADGATVTLDNLPLTAGLNIVVQASLPTTPPNSKTWNVSADFSSAHHATLLLTPDPYGRPRPRLVYSGRLAHPDLPPQGPRQ